MKASTKPMAITIRLSQYPTPRPFETPVPWGTFPGRTHNATSTDTVASAKPTIVAYRWNGTLTWPRTTTERTAAASRATTAANQPKNPCHALKLSVIVKTTVRALAV